MKTMGTTDLGGLWAALEWAWQIFFWPNCGRLTDLSVMGIKVGVANFFFDQSIGFDETNTFQLKFLTSMKIVGVTVFH